MTGKKRDQIERVWLIPDQEPLPIMLMREYEGTQFIRAPLPPLQRFFCVPDATRCAAYRTISGSSTRVAI